MFLSGLPLAYWGGYQKAALNGPLILQGLVVGVLQNFRIYTFLNLSDRLCIRILWSLVL